jgi:molybdopterin/thiamine biosynthesis adenylyltransferase
MPEGDPASASLQGRREAALDAVGGWLAASRGPARRLDPEELRSYANRNALDGWRLDVSFTDGVTRRLDLLANPVFPWTPLRVILVDRPPFLTWPHVEEDGALCILAEGATAKASNPVAAAKEVVGRACDLLEECIAGTNAEDFRAEFCSYWYWARTKDGPSVWSLLRPGGPMRIIRLWRGQKCFVVGEDDASLKAWLRSALGSDNPREPEPALFLWLDRPLVPSEYPETGEDVAALARRAGGDAVAELQLLAAGCPQAAVVVVGAESPNGPCLAAVSVSRRAGQSVKSLQKGFRPNRVPPEIASGRFFAGATVIRSVVDRADPAWVHGRGQDPRFARLRASRVVIVGCGSVGAPVAVMLAEAGVGRFALVDPDDLKWANVGRHPLGADSVGANKALALAKRIRTSFPHTEVEPHSVRWEDLPGDLGDEADLVVSATGNWPSDGMLNEWHVARGRTAPVVYGWTEAHACAGHAVAITGSGGCLECGFDDAGAPRLRVCKWESETTLQEPACGAVFQPYGPIELGHVSVMIAELAMDCLLGTVGTSTHRIWVDRRRRLAEAGGTWTAEWVRIAGDRADGGFLHEAVWAASADCRVCPVAPAA